MEKPIFKFALREDLIDQPHFLPSKAERNATGYDVKAAIKGTELIIKPFEYVKIPLGFRAFCPEGWWFELKPRSSSFAKKHLHALYGTIDQDFFLELVLAVQYIPSDPNGFNHLKISYGEALGQIIPVKRQEMTVENVSNEEFERLTKSREVERNGGFGSSDPKDPLNISHLTLEFLDGKPHNQTEMKPSQSPEGHIRISVLKNKKIIGEQG